MSDIVKPHSEVWEKNTMNGEWIDVSKSFPDPLRLTEEGEMYVGVVNEIKTVRQGKKRRKVKVALVGQADTGEVRSLWESASLRTLMSRIRVGDTIALQYLGERKLAKKRSIRDYRSAIKRG